MNGVNCMLPSIAGRPGVSGLRCLGVPRNDRLSAGVKDVEVVVDGENKPRSEKRTLFDLRVDGVLAVVLSDVARGFAGDDRTLLLRFDFRNAIGKSEAAVVFAIAACTKVVGLGSCA